MIKNLLLTAVVLVGISAGATEKKETVLSERTYNLRLALGNAKCWSGVRPNGRNYPTNTTLLFDLPTYIGRVEGVLINVHKYQAEVGYDHCSNFEEILLPADKQQLIAQVHQRIVEEKGRNRLGECIRVIREESVLTVDEVVFRGSKEFVVGPLTDAHCN